MRHEGVNTSAYRDPQLSGAASSLTRIQTGQSCHFGRASRDDPLPMPVQHISGLTPS